MEVPAGNSRSWTSEHIGRLRCSDSDARFGLRGDLVPQVDEILQQGRAHSGSGCQPSHAFGLVGRIDSILTNIQQVHQHPGTGPDGITLRLGGGFDFFMDAGAFVGVTLPHASARIPLG